MTIRVGRFLDEFVERAGLGHVGAEMGFTLSRDPDVVRAPDVHFVRADVAREIEGRGGFPEATPDLAVEVVSPNDRASAIERKVDEYLTAGTRAVWVVYPDTRRVHVHTPDAVSRVLRTHDTLDGGDVLPGFSVPVARLFD